jgi:hypothetical protein
MLPFVVPRLSSEEGGGHLVELHRGWQDAGETIRHVREACLVTIVESGHPIPTPESKGSSGQSRPFKFKLPQTAIMANAARRE